MEKKKLTHTSKLTIIGLLLIVVCFLILGSGRSQLEPFFIVFPYGFLASNYLVEDIWIIIILMLLQYPAYGYLLDKSSARKLTALIIAVIHISLAIIAFQNLNPGFK